tara:strand:- start:17851 stop:22047 length:4197 start_codon:yes stop_codon:yes gene_type:complete
MKFNKELYKVAKEFFEATLNPTVFKSKGQSTDINSAQNLFAINCARVLINNKSAFLDPIDKKGDFQNFARSLRLNDFVASGKDLDAGYGNGSSNNLVYRLAIEFLNKQKVDLSKINSKLSVIKKAFEDPEFEAEFLANDFLDDPNTYECITKQAFYKWHYDLFVSETPQEEKIPQQNPLDGSTLGWTNLEIDNLTSRSVGSPVNTKFFISQSGAPFNTGFPILCTVFEVGGIKNFADFLKSKRFKEIETEIQEQVSTLFNRGAHILTRVEKITHKNLIENRDIVIDVQASKGGSTLIKFCIAYDYAALVMQPVGPPLDRSLFGKIKLGISNKAPLVKTFKSTSELSTDQLITEQFMNTSLVLNKKDAAVQQGPALFFDLTSPTLNGVKKSLKKSGLKDESINSLLSRQYSLSLEASANSLVDEYNFLVEQYKTARLTSPLFKDFDPNRISEDVAFYYDESFELLAILGINKTPETNKTSPEIILEQKNLIPFEYQLGEPVKNLEARFSLLPFVKDTADPFSNLSGIDGEIALITENFANELKQTDEFKDINLNETGIVLSNSHHDFTISRNNKHPISIILASINGFFYNSNEIILFDEGVGIRKEPGTSLIEFLKSKETFESSGIQTVMGIDEFLLKFHYPILQISPSVEKITAQDISRAIVRVQRAFTAANIEIAALKKGGKEVSLQSLIEQRVSDNPFASKERFTKTLQKEVLIIAAATSKEPCLGDLTAILKRGGINAVYEHLLTKFNWDQILARILLKALNEVSEHSEALETISAATDTVASCLGTFAELGESIGLFLDWKETYTEFKKELVEKTLPSIPSIPKKLPYVFVLDFEAFFRRKIERSLRELGTELLNWVISASMDQLKDFCELDDRLKEELTEFLNNGIGKDPIGQSALLPESIGSATSNLSNIAKQKFTIDIVQIIIDSNVAPLNNVLGGAVDLFPILSVESANLSDRTSLMREYLDALSENITPQQLKSLLDGVQSRDLIKLNKIIVENLSIIGAVKTELSNSTSLSILFAYLDDFINREILETEIANSVTRLVDGCFIKFSAADPEQIAVVRDIVGEFAEQTLLDVVNEKLDQINSFCFEATKFLREVNTTATIPIVSQRLRGTLASLLNSNITNSTLLQGGIKESAKTLIQGPLKDYFDYQSGEGTVTKEDAINAINKAQITAEQKQFLNDTIDSFPKDISDLLDNITSSAGINVNLGKTKFDFAIEENRIIFSLNGEPVFIYTFKKEKTEGEKIGVEFDLSKIDSGKDTQESLLGLLDYYEVLLNRAASNEEKKGKQGYVLQTYNPERFDYENSDSIKVFPHRGAFFEMFEQKSFVSVRRLIASFESKEKIEIEKVFEDLDTLQAAFKEDLDQVLDESGNDTNFHVSNLFKMKELIKKAKG